MANTERPIVVIDGMCCWIRFFLGNQETNAIGEPFGGPIGFLRLVKNLLRQFTPSQIVVVWESGGGSKRRKKLLGSYKEGAGASETNRDVFEDRKGFQKDLMKDESLKAKQLLFLNKILKQLAVRQVYVRDAEGDDVVAFLLKEIYGPTSEYASTMKIVVSNDKDYYQFLDDPQVRMYHPGKKLLYNQDLASEDCAGIFIGNYCVAKALTGDNSDNIDGVPGVGYKSLAKYYPVLTEKKEILLGDFIDYTNQIYDTVVKEQSGKKKPKIPNAVQNVKDHIDIIKRNYKLIYIGSSALTSPQQDLIRKMLHLELPNQNLVEYLKIFREYRVNIMQEHEILFTESSLFVKRKSVTE